MRAKEFLREEKTVTINIPITITIPSGNGDPQVAMPTQGEGVQPSDPVNVFPLQQELELMKHDHGKESKVINQILKDNGAFSTLSDEINYDLDEDYNDLETKFREIMKEMEKPRAKRL